MVLEDGRIVSDVFDRMSLLRFLETRFGTKAPNLTMAANDVGDLTSTLDVDRANPWVPETRFGAVTCWFRPIPGSR